MVQRFRNGSRPRVTPCGGVSVSVTARSWSRDMRQQQRQWQRQCEGSGGDTDDEDDIAAAEDDGFLDAISQVLSTLRTRIRGAIEWSDEAAEVVDATAQAFTAVVRLCESAGLVLQFEREDSDQDVVRCDAVSVASTAPPWPESPRRPVMPLSPPVSPLSDTAMTAHGHGASSEEDAIEVEITDLVVHTQMELQRLENRFEQRLRESEARHAAVVESQRAQIVELTKAVERSQATVVRLESDIVEANGLIRKLQRTARHTQQMVEQHAHDQLVHQTRICTDLVVEKRELAKQLAEERGKYQSLKEHMALHPELTYEPGSSNATTTLPSCDHEDNQTSPRKPRSSCSTDVGSLDRAVKPDRKALFSPPLGSAQATEVHATSASLAPSTSFRRYYLKKLR